MKELGGPVRQISCPYQPRAPHRDPALGFWLAIALVIGAGVALAWVTWP